MWAFQNIEAPNHLPRCGNEISPAANAPRDSAKPTAALGASRISRFSTNEITSSSVQAPPSASRGPIHSRDNARRPHRRRAPCATPPYERAKCCHPPTFLARRSPATRSCSRPRRPVPPMPAGDRRLSRRFSPELRRAPTGALTAPDEMDQRKTRLCRKAKLSPTSPGLPTISKPSPLARFSGSFIANLFRIVRFFEKT